ncbi:MAG: zinc ribbon domain-containing protein [Acidobacteriia bacterium]|nr:zinc ribbon domain-containing protein [Terriglobia bacterium]
MVKEKLLSLFRIYLLSAAALIAILVLASAGQPLIHSRDFTLLAALVVGLIGSMALLVIFVWIGIGVIVYHDAKRRGMEPLLWALVATLIPYFLGLIAYLIVRHPIQSMCPACGQAFPVGEAFCRHCGQAVQAQCPSCGRPTAVGARFCPHCGSRMAEPPAPPSGKPVVL